MSFTDILTMGSAKEKAAYSFKLLDMGNKGYITENDIGEMMKSVFEVWNIMTNSKVVVLPEYVKQVYRQLDKDGDGTLTMDEYQDLYMKDKIVFGWYEYLNQEEYFVKSMLNKEMRPLDSLAPDLTRKIDELKGEVGDAMRLLMDIENKSNFNSRSASPSMSPMYRSRTNTPPPMSKTRELDFTTNNTTQAQTDPNMNSESPYKSNTTPGMKSKILMSQIPRTPGGVKGPSIEEIVTVECSLGDTVPIDPCADDSEIEEYLYRQAEMDAGEYNGEPVDPKVVRQKIANIGGIISSIEKLEKTEKDEFSIKIQRDEFAEAQKDPTRRQVEAGKKNLGLFFGHENWNMIMNMMIGFRAGLKVLLEKDSLVDSDYQHIVRHDINNVTFMSKFDKKDKFILNDHAPYVFDDIRKLMGIEREDYQRSLGPEGILGNILLGYLNTMKELGAQGGSGSLFYLTPDSKYFIKTIRRDEFDVAFGTLKKYHEHLRRNTNSLIIKVTGLYSIETYIRGQERTIYICVTKNVFSDLKCELVYDLKGSTHGRSAKKGNKGNGVLKDLDWVNDNVRWKLDKGLQSYISQVIESDVTFLSSIKVMDYSLLLGIHTIKGNAEKYLQALTRPIDVATKYPNGSKKAIHNAFRGGVISHDKSCIYMFAIIDIYTYYSGSKKTEHFFKTIFFGEGISSVNPELYGARFKKFIYLQFG